MSAYATLDLPILGRDGTYVETFPSSIVHDIAPHLAHVATFAVHRSEYFDDRWQISHVETGMRIGLLWQQQTDAINNARTVLELHTPRAFAVYVRRAVKCNPEIAKRDLFGIAR